MMTVKMSEKDSKEEILKAFKLFDDDDTVSICVCEYYYTMCATCRVKSLLII